MVRRVAVALALVGAGVAGAGLRGPAPTTCATPHLRLAWVRILDAAGHRIWDLALTNAGTETCSLRGYPLVKLLDRRGRPTTASARARGFPLRTVVLTRGQRAFFSFSFAAAGPCLPHYFTAYGLEVIPPRSTRTLRLRHPPFTLCSVSLGGRPQVTPVRAKLNER